MGESPAEGTACAEPWREEKGGEKNVLGKRSVMAEAEGVGYGVKGAETG